MERICVGALVVQRQDGLHLLLGKRAADRAFFPDVWDVPGGHCEPDEALEQTLVRELQEEIGITPTAWEPLSELRGQAPGDDETIVLYLYAVTAWTGTPRNCQPEEHAAVAWFALEDACLLALAHPAYPALFRRAAATTA